MKQLKSLIAIILTLLMIISCAPLSVLADTPQEDVSGSFTYEENEKYNLNWSYTAETDTLYLDAETVSSLDLEEGVNHLPLYYTDDNSDTVLWKGTYSNIVFGNNVKTLGKHCLGYDLLEDTTFYVGFEEDTQVSAVWTNAFSDYTIDELRIPDTVNNIGDYALSDSTFGYVSLPNYQGNSIFSMGRSICRDSVIDEFDFNGCRKNSIPDLMFCSATINNITIPDSITLIGGSAFQKAKINCDFVIPASVHTIKVYAFNYAQFKSISFEGQPDNIYGEAFKQSKTENESHYVYDSRTCNVVESAFQWSDIITTDLAAQEEPETPAEPEIPEAFEEPDNELHDVSGFYKGEIDAFDLTWSYTASTDTLYLDGAMIGDADCYEPDGSYRLPLYYTDEDGDEHLWTGNFSNVVFGSSVKSLRALCLGGDKVWSENTEPINISFAEASSLKDIGRYALAFYKLGEVILPDTVYSVQDYAFSSGEYKLIRLPHYTPSGAAGEENFTLGSYAFEGSTIEALDFNDCGIETIPSYAFYGTTLQSDLYIPQSVRTFAQYCFEDCSAKKIVFPEYDANNKIRMESDAFYNVKADKIDFNDCNITSIPAYAFYSAKINDLRLSPHIIYIYGVAFSHARIGSTLEVFAKYFDGGAFSYAVIDRLVFTDQVNYIAQNGFYNCIVSKSSSLTLSRGVYEHNVGTNAFYGSNINVIITDPEDDEYVDTKQHDVSGHYAAQDLNWSYTASNDTLYLDAEYVRCITYDDKSVLPLYYKNNDGLNVIWLGTYSNVVFSDKVTDLGKNCLGVADWNKSGYINVSFEENSSLEVIGNSAFEGAKIQRLVLPDTVYDLGKNAFKDSTLEYIKLPNYTGDDTCVNESVFEGCVGLEIDFNGFNIEEIPEHFFDSAAVTLINFPSSIKAIGRWAFSDATIENDLYIPSGVKQVCSYAFEGTNFKGEFDFESNTERLEIYNYAFSGSNISSVTIPASTVILAADSFANSKSLKSVTFEEGFSMANIPAGVFKNCSSLTAIKIPRSVKAIGEEAFLNCSKLGSVEFENGTQLEEIYYRAFANCLRLQSISVPEGVKTIYSGAFSGSGLRYAYLPSTLTTLESCVFQNASSLRNINIPSGLTALDESTFEGCTMLNITIPDNIESLGNKALYDCRSFGGSVNHITSFGDSCLYNTAITQLDLSDCDAPLTIGDYAFSDCESLESASFENSTVSKMGKGVFREAYSLESIILPSDITEVPEEFAYDTAVSHIELPDTVKSIGDYAFTAAALEDITIPSATDYIGRYAFAVCYNLSEVNFSQRSGDYYEISHYAFMECTSLKSITIPRGLNNINSYCFFGSGLESINLPSSLKYINQYAFASSQLLSVVLPKKVQRIREGAFQECIRLNAVEIEPDSELYQIDLIAFQNCTSLTTMSFPEGLNKIDNSAFSNCRLRNVELPLSCASVGDGAFADNPLLSLTVSNKRTTLNKRSFFYSFETQSYNTAGMIYGYVPSTAQTYAFLYSIPFSDLGASTEPDDDEEPTVTATSGTYQGGTWSITGTTSKTLNISGGNIGSLYVLDENGNSTTFAAIAKEFEVKTVYIGNGITSIPDLFLYDASGVGIQFVRLPLGLKSIGAYAFAGTSVKKFYSATRNDGNNSYIPKGVSYIGAYAFAYTDSLDADFILPRELTEISEGLFFNSSVPHIDMFGKVTRIAKKAFAECDNMTTLYVPCSVTEIYTDGNVDNNAFGYVDSKVNTNLWVNGRNGSAAYEYCRANNLNFGDVKGLPYRSGTFTDSRSGLYESKINWEYYAEDDTVILSAVSPRGVVESDWNSFNEYNPDSNSSALVSKIYKPEDYSAVNLSPERVLIDGIYEFTAPKLLSVFNPEKIECSVALRKIGARTFVDCVRVKEILLPTALTYAGEYAFENCTSLERVRLGHGISTVAEGVFSECRSLESVDLGNVVLENIGAKAFYNCNSLKFVNLKNQTGNSNGSIGAQAFYNCVNLQDINIPGNIKTIGEKAFYNCVQAQSLNISGNVESIGKDAFANLFYCERITYNSEVNSDVFNDEKSIFANLGAYTNGIELNIGNGVENVDFGFFDGLNITSLNIGNNVSSLDNIQYLEKLKEVNAGENSVYSVKNKLLYSGNTLVLAPQALTQVDIDPQTRAIGEYAFYGTNAKSITLPDSVEALSENSFASSKALVGITLSEGLSEIPEAAFKNCEKLRLLNLPENIFIIRSAAFEGCKSLVSVLFNNSLYTISDNAFYGCSRLEGLAFPEELNYIGDSAFADCTSLKYAYIWHTTIGNNAFKNDDKLNIFTPVGSDAYRYAREVDIPYSAYTDEELFFDEWAIKVDALAGYLGYCEEDGHGDIQYLTVYQADCENDGYVIGVCEYCSEILEEIHIDAYGHNYKIESEIPATATTRGISVYKCENCNQSYTSYTAALDENAEIQTHTVSGTIELAADRNSESGIAPAKNASIVIDGMVVATTDSDGEFSFETETGAYQAQIRYAYGFTRDIYIVVNDEDIEYSEPIVLIGCDFSKDGVINDEDVRLFGVLISAKKNDPSYLAFVDLNADGFINAKDMLYIKAFDGIAASGYKYPVLIIS